jgi:hypothetical protein
MLGALIWAVRQKRHVLGVIVALAALAVGIPLLWALYYLSTFDTLQGFVSNITDAFGLPSSLANAGAALLLVPAVMVFGMVVSLSGERRTMGLSLLTIGIAAYWVLIWAGTRDHLIATDGSQLRCYTISQDGVRFFETQQIDPRTGEMCQWVDQENLRYVQAIDRRLRSGEPIRPLEFRSRDEVRFFATGTNGPIPLVWYHQNSDGSYELFDMPGVHPIFGTQLEPISHQVAQDWLEQSNLVEGANPRTTGAAAVSTDRYPGQGQAERETRMELTPEPLYRQFAMTPMVGTIFIRVIDGQHSIAINDYEGMCIRYDPIEGAARLSLEGSYDANSWEPYRIGGRYPYVRIQSAGDSVIRVERRAAATACL